MNTTKLLMVIILILCSNLVSGEEGLVAHYSFDEGQGLIAHDSSGNGNDGKISGGVTWVKRGSSYALEFDGKTGAVDCGKSDSLLLKGDLTLEAWVKTSDKSLADDMVIFGDGATGGVNVNYYLFKSRGALRFDHADGVRWENIYYSGNHPVFTGEWQHIAFVAEYPNFYYYIDGELAYRGDMKLDISPTAGGNRIIGGWWAGHFNGQLDDIRLYKRALSGTEIADHAALENPKPWIEIATQVLWVNKIMGVDFKTDRLPVGSAKLRLSLTGPDIASPKIQEFDIVETKPGSGRAFASARFITNGFKKGEYTIRAEVKGTDGSTIVSGEKKWQCGGDPSWLGSKVGVTDKLLKPWTPVKVKQDKGSVDVNVWGRTYRFGNSVFPTMITTRGKKILASPIYMSARVNGANVLLTNCRTVLKESSRTRAILESTGIAGDFTITANHKVEYDGLVTADWKIIPKNSSKLDELVFEIPFNTENARYLHYSSLLEGAQPNMRRGELQDGVHTRPFTPYMWLGDEERGLQWMCESGQNWLNTDAKNAIRVTKDTSGVRLRISLVDHPVEISPGGLSYTFALQASPVKPMEKDAWDYRIVNQQLIHYGKDFELLTEKIDGKPILDYYQELGVKAILINNWTKVLCYTKPLGFEKQLHDLVRECHKRGIKVLPYFGSQISEWAPEWTNFGAETIVHPDYNNPDFYPGDTPQTVHVVCLNSEWQDFMVDTIAQLIDEYDVDGVYMDGTAIPMACTNTAHACGFVDSDGKLQPTYKIFAVRNTIKRLYEVVKSRKPDGILDAHASGTMNLPAYTYCTTYWTGEDLPRASEGNYADILPLDRFRTDFMGYQWGIGAEFLHYRFGDYTKSLGISLLHDVPVRAGGVTRQEFELMSSVWKLRETFGVKKAQWFPYWNNAEYLNASPNGIYVSMYKHPKNGILAVVSNVAGTQMKTEIRLNMEKLGMKKIEYTAKDALSGEALPINEGVFSFDLESMGWRIIQIR